VSSCKTSNERKFPARRGRLFVISAPSGAGKSTLIRHLRAIMPELVKPVSATTRPPRPGEVHGTHYYFLRPEEFDQEIAAGGFVEWAEVHGNRYGTLKRELDRCLASGRDVIMELDVQGMRSLRKLYPELVAVFIAPPSMEELERRIRDRGGESESAIQRRLATAKIEMDARMEYNKVIVNDRLEDAVDALRRVVADAKEGARVSPPRAEAQF